MHIHIVKHTMSCSFYFWCGIRLIQYPAVVTLNKDALMVVSSYMQIITYLLQLKNNSPEMKQQLIPHKYIITLTSYFSLLNPDVIASHNKAENCKFQQQAQYKTSMKHKHLIHNLVSFFVCLYLELFGSNKTGKNSKLTVAERYVLNINYIQE